MLKQFILNTSKTILAFQVDIRQESEEYNEVWTQDASQSYSECYLENSNKIIPFSEDTLVMTYSKGPVVIPDDNV